MRYDVFCFAALMLVPGCDFGSESKPDEQFIMILYQYDFQDEVDTFSGTLTKDLVLDGTATIPFWLTTSEQELIVSQAIRSGFFSLPDTLQKLDGSVSVSPDPSPDLLQIETNKQLKTVVWYYPLDTANHDTRAILQLTGTIRNVVESRHEYKRLPPRRGGYL